MNKNENNGFQYTYSAKEQAELKKLREKYLPDTGNGEADKMEKLRKLDRGVENRAATAALCMGVIGVLLLGLGMSLIMTELKELLGAFRDMYMLIGVLIGFVGILGVLSAHPIHRLVLARGRKKIAPEILRLTDELMKKDRNP